MIFNEKNIRESFDNKGYKFFTDPYSINVFAVRMKTHTNNYDDFICQAYYDKKGAFTNVSFVGTTEPGLHWLKNPMRTDGCAIMVPGQYIQVYKVGPHGSTSYEACRQIGDIAVYRDNNRDHKHDLDSSTIQKGLFYTNIHHGWSSPLVGKNSAGCIVVQRKDYFEDYFMPIIKKSVEIYGNSFSFTLLEQKDLKI